MWLPKRRLHSAAARLLAHQTRPRWPRETASNCLPHVNRCQSRDVPNLLKQVAQSAKDPGSLHFLSAPSSACRCLFLRCPGNSRCPAYILTHCSRQAGRGGAFPPGGQENLPGHSVPLAAAPLPLLGWNQHKITGSGNGIAVIQLSNPDLPTCRSLGGAVFPQRAWPSAPEPNQGSVSQAAGGRPTC